MHLLLIGGTAQNVAMVVILIDLGRSTQKTVIPVGILAILEVLWAVCFSFYTSSKGWSLHDLLKKPPTKIIPIRKPVMSPSGGAKPISSLSKKSASGRNCALSPQEEVDRTLDKIRNQGPRQLNRRREKIKINSAAAVIKT
ncbi:MAG: hypothetical protein IPO25_19795 [Saprospiraceae bacterium]|nr:hypothetical protein [Saprospiraceae bacterium]